MCTCVCIYIIHTVCWSFPAFLCRYLRSFFTSVPTRTAILDLVMERGVLTVLLLFSAGILLRFRAHPLLPTSEKCPTPDDGGLWIQWYWTTERPMVPLSSVCNRYVLVLCNTCSYWATCCWCCAIHVHIGQHVVGVVQYMFILGNMLLVLCNLFPYRMRFIFRGVCISQILSFSNFRVLIFADSHVLPLHKSPI